MVVIARWMPRRELDAIERRMRRMLEDIGFVSALLPAADAYETADEFVVELELAGYEERELSIEVSDGTLKITGERTSTTEDASKTFQHRGRLESRFERRFKLPSDADAEHIKAVFEKSVLQVRVPKRQAGRSQEVQISKPGRSERET
jgi:HSP20 family protein